MAWNQRSLARIKQKIIPHSRVFVFIRGQPALLCVLLRKSAANILFFLRALSASVSPW